MKLVLNYFFSLNDVALVDINQTLININSDNVETLITAKKALLKVTQRPSYRSIQSAIYHRIDGRWGNRSWPHLDIPASDEIIGTEPLSREAVEAQKPARFQALCVICHLNWINICGTTRMIWNLIRFNGAAGLFLSLWCQMKFESLRFLSFLISLVIDTMFTRLPTGVGNYVQTISIRDFLLLLHDLANRVRFYKK